MINKYGIFISIMFILFGCNKKDATPKNEEKLLQINVTKDTLFDYDKISICRDLTISTYMYSWEKLGDSSEMSYVKSELWSEYDDNKTIGARPFPNDFFIHTYVFDGGAFMGGRNEDINPFKLVVKAQLKYGINISCTQPSNYQLTPEIELLSINKIDKSDFMKMVTDDSVKPIEFKSNPFKLKNELLKYKIDGENYFLNQVIIKTYVETLDGKSKCFTEDTHPICTREYQYK